PVGTGSNLDYLDTGVSVDEMPAPAISIVWPEHVFRHPQLLSIEGDGELRDLAGLELVIDSTSFSNASVDFEVVVEELVIAKYRFTPASVDVIRRVDAGPQLMVHGSLGDATMENFLRLRPPTIFLADFSTIVGSQWYRSVEAGALEKSWIQTFSEFGTAVDIERECAGARPGTSTIHDFTESQFLASDAD